MDACFLGINVYNYNLLKGRKYRICGIFKLVYFIQMEHTHTHILQLNANTTHPIQIDISKLLLMIKIMKRRERKMNSDETRVCGLWCVVYACTICAHTVFFSSSVPSLFCFAVEYIGCQTLTFQHCTQVFLFIPLSFIHFIHLPLNICVFIYYYYWAHIWHEIFVV